VRFVCAFLGGVATSLGGVATSLGGVLPMLTVLAVVVFLIRAVWRILSVFVSLCALALLLILFCVIL